MEAEALGSVAEQLLLALWVVAAEQLLAWQVVEQLLQAWEEEVEAELLLLA